MKIFNVVKNGPFLDDLKKNVSKSDRKQIHKVHVTHSYNHDFSQKLKFLDNLRGSGGQIYIRR